MVADMCTHCQRGRISLAQTNVQVSLSLYVEVSHVGTNETDLSVDVVVQCASVGLAYLASNGDVVLALHALERGVGQVGGQAIAAVLVRYEERHAHLHPLAEALVHGQADGVAHAHYVGSVFYVLPHSPILVGVECRVVALVVEGVVEVA